MDPKFYQNLLQMSWPAMQSAIKGGVIIAVASTIYYMLFGGILGMSGMAGSLIKFPARHATKLKAIVLLGILFASALVHMLHSRFKQFHDVMHMPFDGQSSVKSTPISHLAVAGLLVGLGTELSNGCTSGHGLCGLPRFSLRSFLAVLFFLCTAIATATFSVKSHIPDLPFKVSVLDKLTIPSQVYLGLCLLGVLVLIVKEKEKSFIAKVTLFVIGVVFGCGLMVAGMSHRSKIYGFLQLDSDWDPSLLFVLMTGVLINAFTFNFIIKIIHKPAYGDKIENPHGKVTFKLLLGSILFGLGWGIGGLCPGPYILSIPNSLKIAVVWGIPFFLGQKIGNILFGDHHVHPKVVAEGETEGKEKSS